MCVSVRGFLVVCRMVIVVVTLAFVSHGQESVSQ